MKIKLHFNTLPNQGFSSKKRYLPNSGDKLVDVRVWGRGETVSARPPEGTTLVGIPGTDRRPQNTGMAATIGDLQPVPVAMCTEINI